ncbi:MAG: hypothetical protein GWM98_18830, partial [Nitrospinaceae bacterium]|nr:hypothetical protein [Nitrospinaceae bacterium]NIR56162.1 hypothetical protein [Nitrospinaceae bacterium]NIS86618.1 hypothetical protein [Nitrospinaceae bacterium]NIT83448.1 hypothetical protein [Nitrospinaceae bacterium]NIU45656.1 hypothetical protein [Nitrospinaceae bacterium]
YPAPRLDREIRQRTKPGDPILVLPWRLAGPLYFFSDRTLSGILLELDNRMYTRPFWRQKNLEAIRTDPPALVVV